MERLTTQLAEDFEPLLRSPLKGLRQKAFSHFEKIGYPSGREEEWKYTNVRNLSEIPFTWGMIQSNVRSPKLPKGVVLQKLSKALVSHPKLIEAALKSLAEKTRNQFIALNTAFLRDGFFLYVPNGVSLTEPIVLTYTTPADGAPRVTHPCNLLIFEDNTQATVIETYTGEGSYWTNAVTEIVAKENAHVEHIKIQAEALEATHFSTFFARQGKNSTITSQLFSFGGHLVRNHSHILLEKEGACCQLNGLFMGAGLQHVDNQTVIDHACPHTTSDEFYKGILDGHAEGIFNGQVIVRPEAQKIQARQSNKNLLLSGSAQVNTKPNLEIHANDVKCSHGATIGRLDQDHLFYLRSRGLNEREAKEILTYAFASEVIQRVSHLETRAQLEGELFKTFTTWTATAKEGL